MDAIVLVGGEGTRLRPLTYEVPKQMLPVVDRRMIEHVVSTLGAAGIDRVVLSLGHRPEVFMAEFSDGEVSGLPVFFAVEPELLDTAGAIRFAAEAASVGGTFVVQNGDVLADFDLGSLLTFHRERGAGATIQLTPVDDPSSFGVVVTDRAGKVEQFLEKPPPGTAPTNLINAGFYVLEEAVVDAIPAGRRVSIEREIFPTLAASGTLYALASSAYWLDTGTPEKYLQASLDILRGRRAAASTPRAPTRAPYLYAEEDALLEGVIEPPSYFGRGVAVSEGAEVRESVVLAGASVRPGARVTGSILLPGARVERGAVVESSIVGSDATIGPSCKVTNLSVIGTGAVVAEGTSLDGARFPLR